LLRALGAGTLATCYSRRLGLGPGLIAQPCERTIGIRQRLGPGRRITRQVEHDSNCLLEGKRLVGRSKIRHPAGYVSAGAHVCASRAVEL